MTSLPPSSVHAVREVPSAVPAFAAPLPPATRGERAPSPLWLAIELPRLPLEALTRAHRREWPAAVFSSTASHGHVIACSAPAERAGVHPGMHQGAAHALLPGLHVLERDRQAEREALCALAAWAGQYTPRVSLQPPAGLLLEVGGSLLLFGGLERLLASVSAELDTLGYSHRRGVAPTPTAAWLRARAGMTEPVLDTRALAAALAAVPVSVMALDGHLLDALHGMGVRRLGECARLPRDGLARRLGPALLELLDRASGRRPDPRESYQPPAVFQRRLDFPAAVAGSEALSFAVRRLLLELTGLLRALQAGVQRLEMRLYHHGYPSSRVLVGLVAPSRDAAHLLALLCGRLEMMALPAPVESIELRARELLPQAAHGLSLFGEPAPEDGDWRRLVERLRARLGTRAVYGLSTVAAHRPERAWRACEPGDGRAMGVFPERPLWLLPVPEPLELRGGMPWLKGALRLLGGPERVESGWWDGGDAARDYYVATNTRGERYWLFRDLRAAGAWFVHGLFG